MAARASAVAKSVVLGAPSQPKSRVHRPSCPFVRAPSSAKWLGGPQHVNPGRRRRLSCNASDEDQNQPNSSPIEDYYTREGIPASLLGTKPRDENKSSLQKSQKRFVEFFRRASPYVESHRGGIFVVIIPGVVLDDEARLNSILKDIALIHQLGVHLVLVIGSTLQIDRRLEEQGLKSAFQKEYRVTDANAMQAAMEAAGKNTVKVQALLSKGPAVLQLRRQGMPERLHQNVSVRTAFGNFVAAKRRGVVDGKDFGETGEVRYVDAQGIQDQLKLNNVVVLSNLGYSAAGEVLNCHTFEVATMAAIQLKADKMVCMMGEESTRNVTVMADGNQALPLISAERLVDNVIRDNQVLREKQSEEAANSTSSQSWYIDGCPVELCAAIAACRGGVERVHLVDSTVEGALLLELYTRDGLGMMVFSDDYEVRLVGLRTSQVSRAATLADLDALERLLAPLEADGTCKKRDRQQLIDELGNFLVMERNGAIIGCAACYAYFEDYTAEVYAFAVHPAFRGSGRGDRLLESLELAARQRIPGIRSMFLLTTRTMDWFAQRGYESVGPAHLSGMLPMGKQVDSSRNSKMYVKQLEFESDR